jgi:hypothetical protein
MGSFKAHYLITTLINLRSSYKNKVIIKLSQSYHHNHSAINEIIPCVIPIQN